MTIETSELLNAPISSQNELIQPALLLCAKNVIEKKRPTVDSPDLREYIYSEPDGTYKAVQLTPNRNALQRLAVAPNLESKLAEIAQQNRNLAALHASNEEALANAESTVDIAHIQFIETASHQRKFKHSIVSPNGDVKATFTRHARGAGEVPATVPYLDTLELPADELLRRVQKNTPFYIQCQFLGFVPIESPAYLTLQYFKSIPEKDPITGRWGNKETILEGSLRELLTPNNRIYVPHISEGGDYILEIFIKPYVQRELASFNFKVAYY